MSESRLARAVVLLVVFVGVATLAGWVLVRRAWCWWRMDGEVAGGYPAETFGEYRDYIDDVSGGCGTVVLIGPDGDRIDDPDPSTPIEPMTGQLLSSPITVRVLVSP